MCDALVRVIPRGEGQGMKMYVYVSDLVLVSGTCIPQKASFFVVRSGDT